MRRLLDRLEAAIRGLRRRLLQRTGGEPVLLGLGAAVGLLTGLLAVLLIAVIRTVQAFAFGSDVSALEVVLVPTCGALAVGLLVAYWTPEPGGGPIVEVMRTLALRGGRFRARVPGAVTIASGVALGSGVSGGREGPIVLIGGATGSLIGRLFAVDEDRMRALIAAGAAAGIGASFNAPIGGMLFAIEVILGRFRASSLQVIVVASVVASVTAREIVGTTLIYEPQIEYALRHARELGLYLVLALGAVVVGVAFIRLETTVERLVRRSRVWRPLRIGAGGLAVGLVALAVPEVLGTGEQLPPIDGVREPIQHMLDGRFGSGWDAAATLAILAIAKLVASSVAVGTGNAVGTFAPAIFMGAALGGSVGHVADILLPGFDIQPGAYALVGMAAVFTVTARAPLTSILIVFELTGDYGLVLPLMFTAGIATFLADRVHPDSLYTGPLRREGIVYAEPEDIDIMQTVTVGEIMTTEPDTARSSLTIEELREEFRRTRHHGFPVIEDGDRLVGVVTLSDLASALPDARVVADICTPRPLTVTPDDPVFRALRRMAAIDVGRLPVVDPQDHSRLVGLVRRADLVRAYQRAVTRSLGAQQRREVSRLRDLAGVQFLELVVAPDAPAASRAVRTVDWPERTVLTSIRRKGDVVMPHGDTVLEPGDEVVVLTDRDAGADVRRLLAGPGALEGDRGLR